MAAPSVSIIVTSYNQASTLRLLFASLERQTIKDFEVIVADDGSSDGTMELCRDQSGFSLQFVTQEDQGYRKAKILNHALHRAQSDYLIFVDGDVFVERHFVEDHLNLRKKGYFVCGRRVDLGPKLSAELTLSDVRLGKFDSFNFKLILSAFKQDTVFWKRALRLPSPSLRRVFGYFKSIDLLGSNFSAWKSDVIGVNGFSEALESYWGEDGDLYIRLRNIGCQAINAKGLCVQYHVFHKRREPTQENIDQYRRLLEDKTYKWAAKGYAESS